MNVRSIITLLWAFIGLCPTLHGATLPPETRSTGSRTDFSGFLDFPQFNPAQGMLTRVTFSKFAPVTPTMLVVNNGTTSRGIRGRAAGILQYSLPGVNASGDFPGNPRRFDLVSDAVVVGPGRSANLPFPSTTLRPFDETITASNARFSDYVGVGTFRLTYSYLYNAVPEPSSGVSSDAGLFNSLTGTVTYEYTPIPEPRAAKLALMAIVASTWRRRTQLSALDITH